MYFGRGMPSRSSRHAFAIPVPCGGRFSALWTLYVLSVIFAAVGVFFVDADVPHSAHAAAVGLVARVHQVPVGRDKVMGAEFIGEAALGFPHAILFGVVLARQQRPRPGTFIVSKSVVVHLHYQSNNVLGLLCAAKRSWTNSRSIRLLVDVAAILSARAVPPMHVKPSGI
jgi:hypothetical protein